MLKKITVVHEPYQEQVFSQLSEEAGKILSNIPPLEDAPAFLTFCGTLTHMCNLIFDYLPPSERADIATAYGSWFCFGLVLGRSPKLLSRILESIKPKVYEADAPEWLQYVLSKRLEEYFGRDESED